MEQPSPLVIIDATATLFRAHFGGAPAHGPTGAAVGAVGAVLDQLAGYLRRARARHYALVFDHSRDTFRRKIWPAYKASRPDTPPELRAQVHLAVEAVARLGFRAFQVPGWEADDVAATLSRIARQAGHPVWLLSPDKDLLQLVDDRPPSVRVYHPKKRRVFDEAAVFERMSVRAHQVVDYLALAGDASDGVPGVKGVGPKAAAAVLAALGDLDTALASPERVEALEIRGSKRLASLLANGAADANLARRLVALDAHIPLDRLGLRADANGDADVVSFCARRAPQPGTEEWCREQGLEPWWHRLGAPR